jgi:hypothetical protein
MASGMNSRANCTLEQQVGHICNPSVLHVKPLSHSQVGGESTLHVTRISGTHVTPPGHVILVSACLNQVQWKYGLASQSGHRPKTQVAKCRWGLGVFPEGWIW